MKNTGQHPFLRTLLPFMFCLLLSSCMVGPDFKSPPPPKTTHYTSLPLPNKTINTPFSNNAGKSQYFVKNEKISGDWWHIFHSKKINALINEGIANNPDLAAAKATLREAQYTLYGEAGQLMLPSLDFQYTASRIQTNGLSAGIASPTTLFDLYDTSIQSSYLLDIWGGSRRTLEAYAAQVDYEKYQLFGAYLTLTANITTTSIGIASLEAQIRATRELINEEKQILNITKKQFHVGGTSEKNVLAQQTLLAQTQATLPPLQKALSEAQHGLAVLIGKEPSQLKPSAINLNKLTLPKKLPVSLPSALVAQRPDIQASAALLHKASAEIGVATADLLPQINLTAAYGFLSPSMHNLFQTSNKVWNLAAGLTQPLFHGGALIMQRRATIAAFDAAAKKYQQTVLNSFKSVADALRAIQIDAYEFREQTQAEQSARSTFKLIRQQFIVGGANYLDMLNAQEQYQKAKIQRIKAQAARYNDTVALYQALGGGWWDSHIKEYGKLENHTGTAT